MLEAETLIVGGGVAGLAAAWTLAQRGARGVVLLEREPLLGTQSSGLNAAILRTLTHDPYTRELSSRGAEFLSAPPPGFSPVPLVERCGLFLTADAGASARLLASFAEAGSDAGGERVEPDRVRAAFPGLELEIDAALWFPREGRIDIAALLSGFERGARRAGVRIETEVEVAELLVEDGRVVGVRTAAGETWRSARCVVAAGAWAGGLGERAGSPLRLEPRRRHLLVTTPTDALSPRGPVLWHEGDAPFYTRPESGGLLFCACDEAVVDPDRCVRDVAVRDLGVERLARHLPELEDLGVSSWWAGMRTFPRDGARAIGPDPTIPGLFWIAGLGGHGMVAGAAAGARLADALAQAPTRVPGPPRPLGAP